MDRINTPNAVPDGNGPGKRGFRDGNKAEGINPTEFDAAWCNGVQEEIAAVIEAAGIVLDDENNAQLLAAIGLMISASAGITQAAADARYLNIGYMLVRDEKPQNTGGGNTSAAATVARVLNTVVANTIVGASLGGNQITLPSGKYRINASCPVFAVDNNRISFYNVTDAAPQILGTSENGDGNTTTRSFITGRFTIAATKVFELRHYTLNAITNGFGDPVNSGGNEVYSVLEIIKES